MIPQYTTLGMQAEIGYGNELWEIYSAYVKENFPRVNINIGGDHWKISVYEDRFELKDVRKGKFKTYLAADPNSITQLDKKLKRGHVTAIYDGRYIPEDTIRAAFRKAIAADMILAIDKMIVDDLFAMHKIQDAITDVDASFGRMSDTIKLIQQQAKAAGKPIFTASQTNIPIGA